MMKTEFSRSLPQAPTIFQPHTTEERDAILVVIATLERAEKLGLPWGISNPPTMPAIWN